MDYRELAEKELKAADDRTPDMETPEVATISALTAIAYALFDLAEKLNSVDDALRNTIGGMPR